MKTLTLLSLLQTLVLAVLVVLVARGPPRGDRATPLPQVQDPQRVAAPGTAGGVDEERLRWIIRQELGGISSGRNAYAAPVPGKSRNPARDLVQRDRVAGLLEDYARAGSVSRAQMEQLQAEIARLDPASRKAAMSRLARMLNTGQVDGRL